MYAIRIPVLAAILSLSAPAFAFGWGVQGDGKVTTEARSVQGFKRIDLRSSLDAEIKEGNSFSVSLTLDSNLQQLVTTEVKGDVLVISNRENIHPTGHPRVHITVPELRGVDLEGSGDAVITGGSEPRDLTLHVEGSGDARYTGPAHALDVKVNGSGDLRAELSGTTEKLSIEMQGSGDVELRNGMANALKANLSGSGDLKARGLTARKAEVSISGSGDAALTVDGGELRARVTGSGDLDWWGEAAQKDIERSGSGSANHH